MQLGFGAAGNEARVYLGQRSIRSITGIVETLRQRSGQQDDILTSLDWFISRTLMWNAMPVLVLLSRHGTPYAAGLLHGRRFMGVPTGVLKAGNLTGEGGVIAPEAERPHVIEQAAKVLLDNMLAHTVVASVQQPGTMSTGTASSNTMPDTVDPAILSAGKVHGIWQAREIRTRLSFDDGLEGLMARMGRKFRRNLRYYRRRAERDLDCRFLPQLTAEQSIEAVQALHAHGTHPVPSLRARRHESALRKTPDSFAMGLVDGRGTWLSYLAGWRQSAATNIEWQLNLGEHAAASLSTVMRAYALEHESASHVPAIVFVGGTSGVWERACTPQRCTDLLATRQGVFGGVLSAAARAVRPKGQIARLHRQLVSLSDVREAV